MLCIQQRANAFLCGQNMSSTLAAPAWHSRCMLACVCVTRASMHAGVIMWECFHSIAPYHVNRSGRFVRHPCFPDFPKDCPLSFAVLAVSCLAPNPADRPDFAQICGVLTDLAAYLRGAGDAATTTAHLTLTEVETRTGSPAAAAAAVGAADEASSAISGILSRAGCKLTGPATSDSDLSILVSAPAGLI